MKNTNRIILFRFHDNFAVCRNHLEILKKFNPNIKIFGLFGGKEEDLKRAKKIGINNVFNVPIDDKAWKWKNGDLCIRWWYKIVGKNINFDILHLIEWDMILLDSIDNFFKHIKNGVAITGKQSLSKIYNTWDWTSGKQGRKEWLALKKYVNKKYSYNQKPLAGIFGGVCLSREFLKKYSKAEVFSFCNDEVRVPLFAQCFKMKVSDTGLKNKYFNADDDLILPKVVYLNAKKGIKSFHPVREKLDIKQL